MNKKTLLIVVVLFGSCDRKVDNLIYYNKYSHTRQDLLRTHGYYYSTDSLGTDSLGLEGSKKHRNIFILFNNGTFFGGPNLNWSTEHYNPDSLNNVISRMDYWGVYKIEGGDIFLRGYLPFHMGMPYLIKGRILNDTTFSSDWLNAIERGVVAEDSIDAESHFRIYRYFQLKTKPDSTNWMLTNEDLNQ